MFHSSALFDMWHVEVFSKDTAVGTLHQPDLSLMHAHGFSASTDMPVSLYVAELKKLYPRAKFVLTTRPSAQEWFASWSTLLCVGPRGR